MKGPSITVSFPAESRTRAPIALGRQPSVASSTPAFIFSSMSFSILAKCSGVGATPLIFPTRQEVFYLGVPAGDARFQSSAMPVWVDFAEEIYGIPDFKGRGFKVALDRHGPRVDPDSLERVPSAETIAHVREFVARRFPALKDAPIVGADVCQYETRRMATS